MQDIAIIGGGRWGRVILSVLATSDLPLTRITVVTSHNAASVQKLVAQLASNRLIRIVSTLDEIPAAAVIANAARSHGETAQRLVAQGAHLLIEKPVVLTSQEAQHLVALAREAMRVVLPGLSYRFCSYLHHFAQQIAAMESVSGFDLHWSDPVGEIRYGEHKPYDASITVADDVMPHIWTILSVILSWNHIHHGELQGDARRKSRRIHPRWRRHERHCYDRA